MRLRYTVRGDHPKGAVGQYDRSTLWRNLTKKDAKLRAEELRKEGCVVYTEIDRKRRCPRVRAKLRRLWAKYIAADRACRLKFVADRKAGRKPCRDWYDEARKRWWEWNRVAHPPRPGEVTVGPGQFAEVGPKGVKVSG